MKKSLIILGVALLILILIGSIFWLFKTKAPQVAPQQSVNFPTSTAVTGGSSSITQNSFLSNPNVKEDKNNPGYYYVGYQPADESQNENAPYLIRYIAETNYFTIGLLQEPLSDNRKKAETYLMQLLGANQKQMCSLNYAVYAPNTVNGLYSGVDLGFSFCPGAVRLPS